MIELLIVVAIIAIIAAVGTYSIYKSRHKIAVERTNAFIRSALERAQSVAIVAGSRAQTNRLVLGAGCNAPPVGGIEANQVWVNLDTGAGTVNFPTGTTLTANDEIQIECDTISIAAEINDEASGGSGGGFDPATGPAWFAFSPNGRVKLPGNLPGEVFVHVNSNIEAGNAFLVLPSGIMCDASGPNAECTESVF